MSSPRAKGIGLPPRPFLYTLDQISTLLSVDLISLQKKYLYYQGRSIGLKERNQMTAHNIANPDEPPDWRVPEPELVKWMKRMGIRYYDRGFV